MNTITSNSAVNLINSSIQKANDAAQNIASFSINNGEVGGSKGFNANELTKPITQLKEAELENSAGVKILQTDQKAQQSIIDIFV